MEDNVGNEAELKSLKIKIETSWYRYGAMKSCDKYTRSELLTQLMIKVLSIRFQMISTEYP